MFPAHGRMFSCVAAMLVSACATATSDDTTGAVDARVIPDAPSTLADAAVIADAPPGSPDARPQPDAPFGTPDAMPIPDAPPGAPDAMSIPDAAPAPDAFGGGICTADSQCPSGTCDEFWGLCECDLLANDCPGAEVCTLYVIPPGTYCAPP